MTTNARAVKALKAILWISAAAMLAVPAAAHEPTNEYTAADGAWRLYKKNCSGCHGFQGQGIQPAGPPLMGNQLVLNAPPEVIKGVIRNGRKGADKAYDEYMRDGKVGYMNMPPFEEVVISDTELDLLVSYLKDGFQKGQFHK
jgi:mono/diheme cytochrome c family protein